MRRYLRTTTVAALALFGLAGCDNSVLDVDPRDQISDEAVFTDPNLAQAFLNDIYIGLGTGFNEVMLASVTDETMMTHNYGTDRVMMGLISSSDLGALGRGDFDHFQWNRNYLRIRQTNVFLSSIDEAEFDEGRKQAMKGEAFFLRAYFYHNLLRMYGGVPIITKVYGLGEEYDDPRNSFAETVEFIAANADSAAALLPLEQTGNDLGRATRGAALALKSRVLLYAASDLYNENPSGMAETGYTSGQDRQALWRAAKNAAQAVIDLGIYGLYEPDPASQEEAVENFTNLFLQKTSEEAILSRFYTETRTSAFGRFNGPNGYHTWGGNTPLQNLVDAFRMADGSAFSWDDPDHASAPYENRDPRFYASILYDGAQWQERPEDVQELDPYGIIQTYRELRLPNGVVQYGLDTRAGPIEDWNGGYSGYLIRKLVDPNINHQYFGQEVSWMFFRYAEILLNYAEASIELNELDDAVWALNQIRRRAGMPEFSAGMSQAALREEYRNERRVEMAFEEQRFFDARRWMIAPQAFGADGVGIDIFLEGTDPIDRSTWTNYEYVTRVVMEREWDDKQYFLPIHRDELNRNQALVQNPGY